MAWGQENRLGVGGNYVCCLVIVVIFIRFRGSKRSVWVGGGGGLKSSYGDRLKEGSHKAKGKNGVPYFIGELTL